MFSNNVFESNEKETTKENVRNTNSYYYIFVRMDQIMGNYPTGSDIRYAQN